MSENDEAKPRMILPAADLLADVEKLLEQQGLSPDFIKTNMMVIRFLLPSLLIHVVEHHEKSGAFTKEEAKEYKDRLQVFMNEYIIKLVNDMPIMTLGDP